MALRPSRTFESGARLAGPVAAPVDTGLSYALARTGAAFLRLAATTGEQIERQQAIQGEKEGLIVQGAVKPDATGKVPLVRTGQATAYGQAFDAAALTSFGVQMDLHIRRNAQRIALEHPNDPDGMEQAMSSFVEGLSAGLPGDVQAMVQRDAFIRTAPYVEDARERAFKRSVASQIADLETLQFEILAGAEQYGQGMHGGATQRAASLTALAADYGVVLDGLTAAANAGILTPGDARQAMVKFQSQFAEQYIRGVVQASGDPGAIGDAILAGSLTLPFPVPDRDGKVTIQDVNLSRLMTAEDESGALRGVTAAEGVIRARMAAEQSVLAPLIEDERAAASLGDTAHPGLEARIRQAYDPVEAEAIIADFRKRRELHSAVMAVATMTPEEEVAAEVRPFGYGYADEAAKAEAVAEARLQKAKALNGKDADPAAYVLATNPDLRTAWEGAQTPQQVQAAARRVMAEQERIGAMAGNVHVLPTERARSFVTQYDGLEDGGSRSAWVAGIEAVYGDLAPDVFAELQEAGLDDGAYMGAVLNNPVARARYFEALDTHAETSKILGETTMRDVRESVSMAIEPLVRTMADTPGASRTITAVARAAEVLATRAVLAGESPSTAADQAAKEIVDQYDYVANIRVPIGHDVDAVEENLEWLIDRLDTFDIDAMPSLDTRLPPDEARRQYIAALKDQGIEGFRTATDESGVILYDPLGYTVTVQGKALTMPYDAMKAIPRDRRERGTLMPLEEDALRGRRMLREERFSPVFEGDEESMSLPRGIRNNNPGNIRHGTADWQGMSKEQPDASFVSFESPEMGIRAMAKVLRAYQSKHGLDTLKGIITRWAPPSENDTEAYIDAVVGATGLGENQRLDLDDKVILGALIAAMIRHENGRQPYGKATITRGIDLAT